MIIADIFPAREQDTGFIHSREVVDRIAHRPRFAQKQAQVIYGGDVAETTRLLAHSLRSGDLVVIMGAGDIYTVTETLLKKNREQA